MEKEEEEERIEFQICLHPAVILIFLVDGRLPARVPTAGSGISFAFQKSKGRKSFPRSGAPYVKWR
jgi:hypothetical protein